MTSGPPKALLSWSSGKDSAHALAEVQRSGDYEVVALITTITARYGRVSMHGVREALLDRQLDELGLPCRKVFIPTPCPNEVYERAMEDVLASARREGIGHVIFGDLFLEDIRRYREARLGAVGMQAAFPLWGRDTAELASDMIASGIAATVACVDPRQLAPAFAGRAFDERLLEELPAGVDPCGENGEFHTFVSAAPVFAKPIDIRVGAVVERDGFVYADLVPDRAGHPGLTTP